jgi:hypothetical protein
MTIVTIGLDLAKRVFLARRVLHQRCLLFFCLHRNEPHVWPRSRLANGARVVGVGLAALDERLHVIRRDQSHAMGVGSKRIPMSTIRVKPRFASGGRTAIGRAAAIRVGRIPNSG